MSKPTYRAVVCTELGAPEQLRLMELPRPPLGPRAVRITLRACGINFPDVLTIQGRYQHKPELPFVPGVEAAGVVSEVGDGIDTPAVGQGGVIVRLRTGGYAEEAVVAPEQLTALPRGFSFEEGAAFLVAHTTAYHALATRAGVQPGQTLLVLGAAGGVGLAGVQVGKALGARVIAAASTQAKLRVALAHGADDAIDYGAEKIDDAVRRLTSGQGVDVVLDPVGLAQASALRCLAWGGKLLIAGFAGGAIPAYEGNRVLLKGASVIGVRAGEAGRHDPAMRRRELDTLTALADAGSVKPLVSARFPLARYAEAMRLLADRQAVGRVVLTLP